jgi:spore coat polysaccharide biosynthesis protein SpsF
MGRTVMIIQARMGSTRLPGKSLMPLAGKPLVARILERVKRATRLDEIVLATSDTARDDALAKLGKECGVSVFRGSENDLLDRYYRAAKEFRASTVLRLPADNCTPEPSEIDRIVEFHAKGTCTWASNLAQVFKSGYPDGIGSEVFTFDSLEEIWKSGAADQQKREHLHLNYFDYGKQQQINPKYSIGTIPCPPEFARPDVILDVNTQNHYEYMSALYDALYPKNPNFHITDIIAWHDANRGKIRREA